MPAIQMIEQQRDMDICDKIENANTKQSVT